MTTWNGDALISSCGRYRYRLRRWQRSGPYVLFVGLNPSTATATTDDNTVRAWARLTLAWGYQAFAVGNVYALRSRDPKALWRADDPYGPHRIVHLREMAAGAALIVAYWGAHAKRADYEPIADLLATYDEVQCLGLNANGTPKHPLFIPTNVQRLRFAPHRTAA
jgi:hypothetical protein